MWKPEISRPKVSSADPRVSGSQVGPPRGVLPWGGPMDPCEVHVSCSDSSGLASLGLVTWHLRWQPLLG
jgi:hypothetical protein